MQCRCNDCLHIRVAGADDGLARRLVEILDRGERDTKPATAIAVALRDLDSEQAAAQLAGAIAWLEEHAELDVELVEQLTRLMRMGHRAAFAHGNSPGEHPKA